MKSLAQKLEQCTGLVGTKDISARDSQFIADMDRITKANNGSTEWMSSGQIGYLESLWDKHFA